MPVLRLRSRTRRVVVCAVLAAAVAGCRVLPEHTDHQPGATDHRSAASALRTSPAVPLPSVGTALAQLGRLHVVPRRPFIPGYQRACGQGEACVFGPAWSDNPRHDGCTTRQDLLTTVLTEVVFERGSRCAVESGRLVDPYSGATVDFHADDPDSIEVDHVVPLVTSWALGAAQWTKQQRDRFANDSSIELVAVSRASNQAKGDRGPAEYQPRDKCAYDRRFVAVLTKYDLPVIAADKRAIASVLRSCS